MFKKKANLKKRAKIFHNDKGILIFENTSEVIKAENLLKKKQFYAKVVGPPPEVRKGCDLSIEISVIEALGILKLLKKYNLNPLDFVPYQKDRDKILKPINIFQIKDFGDYIMIRAANMKLTIDKRNFMIVNISGGGCPDVPYLASKLIGKSIKQILPPNKLGHTLCGYALQLAYEKAKDLLCWE